MPINFQDKVNLIWNIADDILRDVFKKTEYADIIYPMILIRRIESVLISTRDIIHDEIHEKIKSLPEKEQKKIIKSETQNRLSFDNNSKWTLRKLVGESESSLKDNFINYLNSYTKNILQIIIASGIRSHINKLNSKQILFPLLQKFAELDLSPDTVDNMTMGTIFEELVRKFSEANNDDAGEHYTPREVIQLMVRLLDLDEDKIKQGELVTIYDPACGTGGMLSIAKSFIEDKVQPKANVRLYGQETNDKTWAICEADMILKGEQGFKIIEGDTLTDDGFMAHEFDYMISNPPYGKSWKEIKSKVVENNNGRFNAGYPRVSDGQMLFTLHMISKMKPAEKGGSAIAVVHNGSPLFTGDAGSGESDIRKNIIENDYLDSIIAMPKDLFYNTGIATYIWILRNNKAEKRKGKIQLINGISFFEKMTRSLGNKRNYVTDKQINEFVAIHKGFEEGEFSKIYEQRDFAFRKIYLDLHDMDEDGNLLFETIQVKIPQTKMPQILNIKDEEIKDLRDKKNGHNSTNTFRLLKKSEFREKTQTKDESISIMKIIDGNKISLTAEITVPKIVKDTEIVPWKEDWKAFLEKEVEKPWTRTREEKGYEIPFTQEFYVYEPLRNAESVLMELKGIEKKNLELMKELGL